jgi:hypothetical protein
MAITPEIIEPVTELEHQLAEILEQSPSPFHRDLGLMGLAKKLGIPYRDLDSLAKSLKTSIVNSQTSISTGNSSAS